MVNNFIGGAVATAAGITNYAANGVASVLRGISDVISPTPRRPYVTIADGADRMRRPGPRTLTMNALNYMIDAGKLDHEFCSVELAKMEKKKVDVGEVFCISGFLDPAKGQTNIKGNISKYVSNPAAIRCVTYALDSVKSYDSCESNSITHMALDFISRLNYVYRDSDTAVVKIKIIGHSMGARVAEAVAQLIQRYPTLTSRQINIEVIISVSGANQGSPIAKASPALICCNKTPAKDLHPAQVEDDDSNFGKIKTKARYIATENDYIVPPSFSAPPNVPVVVLRDVSRTNPHTAILNNTIAKYWILKNL